MDYYSDDLLSVPVVHDELNMTTTPDRGRSSDHYLLCSTAAVL